jgi:NAD(P)-dependent dehydrogenase (short-subunit alcohol dehydrogenase family)
MIVLLFFQLYIQFNNIHLWLFGQVNNAGVGAISNEVELSVTTLDTNYFGVKNVTKALLPLLRDTPAGPRIVNVSSMAGALEVIHQP